MLAGADKVSINTAAVKNHNFIKEIAKELNVPIIALAQLSRAVESRGGEKRPMLSDLRESGAIEQDADIVSFIYRPETYGLTTNDNGDSTQGMAEIIIAKHRNGQTGRVNLRFVPEFARFENLHEVSDLELSKPLKNNFSTFNQDSNTYTLPSKMNSSDDHNKEFNQNEDEDNPF